MIVNDWKWSDLTRRADGTERAQAWFHTNYKVNVPTETPSAESRAAATKPKKKKISSLWRRVNKPSAGGAAELQRQSPVQKVHQSRSPTDKEPNHQNCLGNVSYHFIFISNGKIEPYTNVFNSRNFLNKQKWWVTFFPTSAAAKSNVKLHQQLNTRPGYHTLSIWHSLLGPFLIGPFVWLLSWRNLVLLLFG